MHEIETGRLDGDGGDGVDGGSGGHLPEDSANFSGDVKVTIQYIDAKH